MSNFRITLQMHHFFSDHRSSCRVFITSKMKTIQNLQEHISNLFELNADFYLISNNLYLPKSEDVRILREDDIIIAVPCNPGLPFSSNYGSKSETTELQSANDKTFKRNRSMLNENELDVVDSHSSSVKKKKKKKKSKHRDDENINFANTEVNELENSSSVVKKKKKSKKKFLGELTASSDVSTELKNIKTDTKNDSSDGDTSEEIDVVSYEPKITKENNLDDALKKNSEWQSAIDYSNRNLWVGSRNKNIKLMEISTKPKIVKAIRVCDSPIAARIATSFVGPSTSIQKDANIDHQSSLSGTKTEEILLPPTQESLRNQQSAEAMELGSNIPDENKINENLQLTPFFQFNNEVKTRNIHKNEKVNIISVKIVNNDKPNQIVKKQVMQLQSNETIGPQLIPILENKEIDDEIINNGNTQTNALDLTNDFKEPTYTESLVSTLTEESGMDLSFSGGTKRKRKRVRKRKPKAETQENGFEPPVVNLKPVYTQAAPSVHIRFDDDDEDQNKTLQNEDSPDVIDINFNYEKFCKEEITKYPLMADLRPKQGDVIAFKICTLSQSYTPEISDVIVARVLSYNLYTNHVCIKILKGADQCSVPEGKFYMETYDSKDDNKEEEEEKVFLWSELIEPRLLFP